MGRLFDSKQFRTDLQLSGSFSGSFQGSGANLTDIPASAIGGLNLSQIASGSFSASVSQNGGLSVNTDITASGEISASGDIIGNDLFVRDGRFSRDGFAAEIEIIASEGAGGIVGTNTSDNLILRRFNQAKLTLEETKNVSHQRLDVEGNLSASGFISASSLNVNDIETFKMNVTHFTASFITASTLQTSGSNIFGDEASDTHTFIGDIIAENNITASGNIRIQSADPNILIQRTNNSNNASIDFIGQGGATGAQIQFSGSSNELTFGTYDGSSVIERLRIEDGTTPNIIITGSTNISGSATSTASFGTYIGDGAGLTGLGGAYGISNSNGSYTYYTSLSASMAAASTGDVVEVFADVVETNPVTILFKNGVNIQGNGHKYTLDHTGSQAAFADYLSTETSGTSISSSIHNLRIDRINGDSSTGLRAATIIINNDTANHDTFLDLRGSEISNNTSDTYYCSYKHGRVLGGKFIGNHNNNNGRYFVSSAQVQYTGVHNVTDVYCESQDGYAQVDDAGDSTFISRNNTAAVVTQGDFVGCTFVSNATSPYFNGAAVQQSTGISGARLKNCVVYCNGSGTTAIYGVAWIENCSVVNARYYALNYAIDTGGANSFTLLNSSVYSNAGSAIKVQDGGNTGTLRILNNTIHNDRYSSYGAYPTMYLQGWDNSDNLIANNTIVHGGPYKADNLANAIEVHSGGGSNYTFNIVNNTIKVSQHDAFCISSSAAVAPNIVYAQNTFEGANVPVAPSITQALTNVPDAQGNIHVTSSLNNDRIYSGSFSGSYVGDGSQLSGIVTETNFTQSLFVTPAGNNSTAVVGDMMKPFSSILGATGSANPGDTIIVYPGTYIEDRNLYKDGVNYHFLDGAKVVANSPVEPMWGGGTGQSNGVGTSFDSPISITGHGEFISTSSNAMASAIFYIQVPSGVIEFKRALKHGIGAGAYQTAAGFGQLISIDPTGVLTVRGKIENSGSASSYCSTAVFGQGNINTDIVVRSYNGTADGVRLWSDSGDINGTMDVYSEGTGLLTQARTSALSYLRGRFETLTSNQGTYYAMYFGPGYRGSFHVDAEIRGAIYINPGGAYEGSVHVRGYQEVSNSPGGGANVIGSGDNQLSQKIYGVSGNAAFKVTGGRTTYDGQLRLTGYNSKVFDISAGTFYWKGSCAGSTSYPTTRTDPNVVSGGELIIESQFESFSQAANVNNEYMFNLSGGTLDIQSKLRNNIDQVNNGIINMTGGYLRMNGAELVHATQTGSFAYAIDLNGQTHSGSILNNCFTNLQPFNSGSFTNEIVGGGTLFESHKLY